jgi:hypothetical protein
MRRSQHLLVLMGLLLLSVVPATSQTIVFETPPEEIETVIGLLDAVVVAEAAVLSGEPLQEADIQALEALIEIGDVLGAEDLAARTRVLLSLTRPGRAEGEPQPDLIEPLAPVAENFFRRGSTTYDTWIGALTATGGTSLALSGVFYGLAERDFRSWINEGDPDAASELFQAWRGYEILSLTMGGIAVGALGIGIPLLYALSEPAEAEGLPVGQPLFSEAEKEQALADLYRERARLVVSINRLPDVEPTRAFWSTVGLSVGAIAGVTSVTSFYLAGERWEQYIDAPFGDQAESLETQVVVWDVIAISTAVLSVAGFGTTLGIDILTEDRDELELRLREINREIIRIRSSQDPEFTDDQQAR